MEHKPLGYYNYTVYLTYIGMLSGFLGISCVMSDKISIAMICLMVAGICDMFDGAVASTCKTRTDDEKCFGIQIDSLCDLICFGVLPSLIVLKLNNNGEFAFATSAFFVLCALIRLAYFNVDEQNRQKVSTGSREYYKGLPVTTIAIMLPLYWIIVKAISVTNFISASFMLLAVGILFLSPFKLKKAKALGKITMSICGIVEFIFLIISLFGDV